MAKARRKAGKSPHFPPGTRTGGNQDTQLKWAVLDVYAMIDEEEGYTSDWTKDKEIMVGLMDPMKRIHTMPLEEVLGKPGMGDGFLHGLIEEMVANGEFLEEEFRMNRRLKNKQFEVAGIHGWAADEVTGEPMYVITRKGETLAHDVRDCLNENWFLVYAQPTSNEEPAAGSIMHHLWHMPQLELA
ncbi:hypothetical protein DACRYDRAFT_107019 [Dacryopinax primogenitus]|uniref:Uncharacterized protein n=1 Tax=Dacryopinax primogenitus (strain DJM 731) TaxID=1858805 RepID=M5G879_DACPD|nr:uncharacterized protein DACRYDRAFT_107019 [Dacryopinax primogenitus]EJU02072.1 hypothetical protein DACRYDRAFT_107019 [Dacryopinax primogenitus]